MESTEENKEQQPKGLQKHNIVDDRQPLYINIESLIYIIREEQVMLDSDLAKLYGVETKVLNQAVKRNIQRFPSDFMFQLTKEECLRSQIVTLNEGRGKHLKYMPYAEDFYHIGHSLKDLGKKLFAFSKMDVMTGAELVSQL